MHTMPYHSKFRQTHSYPAVKVLCGLKQCSCFIFTSCCFRKEYLSNRILTTCPSLNPIEDTDLLQENISDTFIFISIIKRAENFFLAEHAGLCCLLMGNRKAMHFSYLKGRAILSKNTLEARPVWLSDLCANHKVVIPQISLKLQRLLTLVPWFRALSFRKKDI